MTTAVAWMAPVCALIGICMAAYLGSWVLKQDPGPDKMNSISIKIQQGAKAFLMSEYKLLVIFMVVVGIIMAVALSPITALAFATGGVMSAAAGYAGMHVATRANTRTAHAAEQSVAKALNVSFKSGLTMGLCVASFALLGCRCGCSCWCSASTSSKSRRCMRTSAWWRASPPVLRLWLCSPVWAAASTRRRPTWEPTSWARSKRAFRRTTRATGHHRRQRGRQRGRRGRHGR